jgi:hypothetical protein
MADVHSEYGIIEHKFEALGAEIPVANAIAYGTSAGGCNYYLGDFKVVGDLGETDTGIVSIAKANGYVRISGNNENGKGVALTTEVIFSPKLNGTLVLETRLERASVAAGVVFAGFCDVAADDIAEPLTSSSTTHTLTASDLCGFVLDSQLTASATWHFVYNGGSTTGETDSTSTTTGVVAVAAESDVLRVEIDPDGTARGYVNGVLKSTVTTAVSTTVLQAALVGCWGTTSTAADVDIDYFAVKCNRNWTR